MKKGMVFWSVTALVFSVAFVVFLNARTTPVLASCFPSDASSRAYDEGCGTVDYELEAQTSDGLYDEGLYTVYGFCGGGYTRCDCTIASQYETTGLLGFNFDREGGGWTAFWWDFTDFDPPTYTDCTSGTCQSTGVEEHINGYSLYDQGWDEVFCYD